MDIFARSLVAAFAATLGIGTLQAAPKGRAPKPTPSPACFHDRFIQIADPVREFRLARRDVDASTIKASVDGVRVAHAYAASRNEIQLNDAGAVEATVDIEYCLTTHNPGCTAFDCDGTGI